jgi:hypothetical protein
MIQHWQTQDLTFVKDTAAGFLAVLKNKELLGEFTNVAWATKFPWAISPVRSQSYGYEGLVRR